MSTGIFSRAPRSQPCWLWRFLSTRRSWAVGAQGGLADARWHASGARGMRGPMNATSAAISRRAAARLMVGRVIARSAPSAGRRARRSRARARRSVARTTLAGMSPRTLASDASPRATQG